ncbi:MAG: ABC transporter permease [Hyphomicrobiales bacterium]|nr:ABC transporter permease [Hyphomicrobiales bacterium]
MASVRGFVSRNPQLSVLVLLFVLFALFIPAFMTTGNILNILKQSTTISIIACGLAFVVIGGNLDLSVGALLSLSLGLSIEMANHNLFLALVVPMVAVVAVGFANGSIVGRFRVDSIILTLGSMAAINGVVQTYRQGNIVTGPMFTSYQAMTDAKLFGVPSYILVYIAIALLFQFLLLKTAFGRQVVLQGENKEAAEIAGINTRRVTLISFVLCSASVGVASILMGSRLLQGSTNTGTGMEFDALTAILIGGISIYGGKGTILNAMVGVFLLAIIINGLTLLNVPFEWRNVAKGLLIILAIGIARMRGRAV